ncbi:aminotransferase class I/II-fold pyridoxal phosphate-dependent enzyme [Micromonospora tulbaghiae]|uniref:aminotransferase class I/II-fold pyridoxal phosphate-dependent enzyme n=1 Tax=Micromonospora tulbaghiae TaxID=479978 RepID=UPI0033BE632B
MSQPRPDSGPSREQIEEIGRWAAEKGLWVLTDEIYEHLVYGDAEFHSLPVVVPELADKCIVVNGVAKTYAMTGWRVGWVVGPKDVVKAATNLQSHATSNVSNVAQAAALAAAEKEAAEAAAKAEKEAKEKAEAAKKKAEEEAAKKAEAERLAELAKQYALPTSSYTVTSTFGQAGAYWSSGYHTGLDFAAPTGTLIKAVHTGTITSAGWDGSYGYKTVLTLDDGTEVWYAHQSSINVSVGQKVATGDVIGRVGATGNVTGPHLHFEIRTTPNYGSAVDPAKFLRSHGVTV